MSAIIAALIAELSKVLLPILIEWIKGLFDKAAKKIEATGDDADDAEYLVHVALELTPKFRVFKRALLRKVKDHAADIAAGRKLNKSDREELAALAKKAKAE